MTFQPLIEPRTKYRGRYRPNTRLVLADWKANEEIRERRCGDGNPLADVTSAIAKKARQRPPYSTRTCVYAWMVNPMTTVWAKKDVEKAMQHVMKENDGWIAVDKPKAGWYTNRTIGGGSRAPFFSVEMRNISMDVHYITVLSLKSYGPEWARSQVKIDVAVEPPSATVGNPRRPPKSKALSYSLSGYHDKRISVSYPNRFLIPSADGSGDGAKAGDTVRVSFTKVGGTQFKLSGLALCELAMSE
jgi:hypothetical protein